MQHCLEPAAGGGQHGAHRRIRRAGVLYRGSGKGFLGPLRQGPQRHGFYTAPPAVAGVLLARADDGLYLRQAQRFGHGKAEALFCIIQIRMRADQRNVMADQLAHDALAAKLLHDLLEWTKQQRMVRQDQFTALFHCLLYHGLRAVHTQQNAGDGHGKIPDLQPAIVPVAGQGKGGKLIQTAHKFRQCDGLFHLSSSKKACRQARRPAASSWWAAVREAPGTRSVFSSTRHSHAA